MTSLMAETKRKAVYGHRTWIIWKDRDGNRHAERQSPESVKKAMLAMGTQGYFLQVEANSGDLSQIQWWMACNILGYMKRGWIK